jgi:hypothetical protein
MGLRGRTWTRSGSCWRSSSRPSSGEPTADKRPRLPRPAGGWQARSAPRLGPHWVRTASGTAGPRRARAVNIGESASQVRGRPP